MEHEQDVLRWLTQRNETLEAEIARIRRDAEERILPLLDQLKRNSIAFEVFKELGAPASAISRAGVTDPHGRNLRSAGRLTAKGRMLAELTASARPLTRNELADRLKANGPEVHGATLGSTLSRMVAEGVLMKDGSNRYFAKPAQSVQDGTSTQETVPGL